MVEARVEYDYDAENEDELSLQVGDIITSVERKEDGWWEGHLRGKVGLFPSNFVKVLNKDQSKQSIRPTKAYSNGVQLRPGNPKTKRKRRCRVVYSYTPVNDDELELEVNNVIEVLEEVEEGWWKGILHGQVGVFPSNFVVEIDDVDEATSENKQVSTSALTDNSDYEIKPKPVRGVDLGIILDDKSIQLKPVHESLDRKSISAAKKPPAPSPPVSLCNDGAPVLPPKPDALLTCSSSADLQISSDNEQDWEYSDYLTSPINMQLKRSAPNVSWQKKEDTNVTRCQSWIETLSNKRSTTEASEAYQVSTCDSQESLELDLHLPISLYENYLALAENHCTVFSSQEPQNWSDDFVLNLRFPKVETSDQKSCIHFQNIYSISAFEENANTECENAYDDMPYCCQYETRDQHNFFGMPILTLGNVFHQFIEEDQFVPEVISEHPDIFKKLKNSKSKQNAFSSQKVNYASDIHHTDNSNTTIAVEQINMDSFDNYNKINSKYLIGKHSKLKKKFLDRSLKTPVKLEIWSMSAEMNKFVVTEHSNIADTLEYLHEEAEIIADNNEGKLHESVSINENSLTTEPMEASSETCDKSIVHEFECKVQSKNNKLPSFVKIIHKMPKHAPKEQTDQFLLDMKNGDKRIRSTYKTSQSSGNMDTFDLQKYSKIPSKSSASNASLDDNDSFPCVINLRDNEKQLLLNLIKSLCNSNVKQREQFESRKILRNSENDFVESETCPTIDNYTDKAKHCNIEVSEDMKVFCTSELDTENHDDSTRHISACKYADTAATSKVSTNSEMYHNVCICNEHIGETICDYVDFRPEKEFAKRPACMKYYFTDSPRLLSGSDQSDFVFKRNRSVQDQFKQNHNKSIESTIKKQLAPPLRNENSESDFSKCQQKGHSFSPASKVKEVKSRNKRVTLQKFGQNLNTSSNSEEKQRIIFQRHQSSENKTINKKRRNAPSKRQHSKRQSLHSNSFKSSNSSNMYNLSNNEVIRELSSETITCCGLRRKRNYHPFRFSIASNDSGYTEDRSFKLEDKEDDLSVKVKARDNEIKLYEENKMRSSYNLNCITNKDYGSNQTFLTPAEKKDVMVMTNEIAYFATQDKMIIPKENIEVQTETDIEDKVSPTQFQESISNVMKVSDEAIKSDCLPVTSDDETNKEIRVQQRENSHSEEQKFIPNGSKSVIKDRNSSSDKLEGVVSTNRGSNSCLQKVCKELEASLSQLAAYESSKPTEVLNILEYLEKRKIKPQTSKLKESIRYLKEYHVYPASISVTSPIRSSRSSYKNRSRRNEEPEKASNQNYGPFDEPCSNSGMFEETSCESVVEVDRSYGPFDDPCDFPYPLQDFREERKAIGSQHTAMKEKSNPGDCYNNRPKLKKNDANEGKSGVKCAASERLRNTCQKPPCICTCQNISPPSKLSYSGPKEDSSSKYSVLREEEERESIISGEVENEVLIESEIGVFGDLDVDSKYYQTVSSASCSECSPLKSYVCFYDEGNKPQRLKSLSGVPCKICSPIRHQKPRFALNKYSQTEKGDAESCSSGSICEICDPYEGFTEMQVVSAFICPNSQQTCSNEKKCPKCHLPRVSEKYNSLPEVSRPSRLNAVNVCKDTCTQTEFQSVRLCSASKDSNSSLDNYNVKVSPDSNYEYQMSQSDYNNKVDHAQSLQEHYKQRLTSQHKSFQTSQHKAIQTSQHKAIQTSQHKAIQASQHKAIQAYQHKCMQTSHHKAIQASHKAIQASNRSVRCHFVERSPSPTEVVTQSGYIEDDYSSPLQRDVLSGDSNSLTCHPPSDQNSSARENSVEYYKDFEQYQHGLRKKSSQRQDNKPSKKESDVCTCNLNATDNRKHNRNKHSEVHHNATYDKTMMLDYSGDMGKKFPQQLENNQIENQFPSKSQGTVIRKYPSLSEIQRIYNSNDNDEGVISRIYEEYVTISMEYPETCQVNKSVQTVECCVQPQRSEVKPGLSSNLHTHPYEGKTSCTCEEKNCYNSFTNKNQCTEAMTLIKYSPQHSSLNGEFSDFSYPSENRYYMEAVYPVSQHGQREPLPNPSSKSFRKGNQPSELQSSNPSRFYPRILNTSQASYSLCAECSKKELLRKVEEKHPVNDETSKLCVCLNNKEKINTDKSILDSVFDRKNKLYRDLKKNTLDAFKQQSPNKNDFDGRSQANKLKEEYPCNCICQKKLEDNTDVISSHAAKSSAIYQVKCSSPVNVPSAESSYLAKKFLETNNIVKDPQRHKVKEKDVRIISEKENTASMLINEGLKENLKQETVPDGSTKKDRLKQQPASSQNPVCNLCRKKPCCCRQVCRTCFQLPCVCIRNCSVCLCTPCICKKKHFKSLVNSIDHSKVVSRNVPKHITIREDNAATATSLPAPDTKAKKHPKSHKCVLRPPHNKKCHKCLNKEERPELEKSKKLSSQNYRNEENGNKLATPCKGTHQDCSCVEILKPKTEPWSSLKNLKEQARAIFPYEACNEDELTLREGDLITILSKDVEDKGWWKGELNNKVGLFPDNFVMLLSTSEVKPKKPERPDKIPHLIKKILPSRPDSSGSKGPTVAVHEPMKRSLPDVIKKDDKLGPPLPIKKPHLPPPMKKPQRPPTLPSESLTDDMKAKSQEEKHVDNVTDKSAFDSIEPSADKLTHLTATRAKNPHRRPPSYLFLRENQNSAKEKLNANSENQEETEDFSKANELIVDTPPPPPPPIIQEVIIENEKKPVKPTSLVVSPPVTPAPPKRTSDDIKTTPRPPVLKSSESDSKLLTNLVRPKPQVLAPKPLISQKEEVTAKKLSTEGSSLAGINDQIPEDSRSRDTLTSLVEDLSNQVLSLHQALDTQKKYFSEKIRELTLEIDEEKKIRMTMQVEIDRLYKLVKE